MQYRLIKGSSNDISQALNTVLRNRGIANPKEYLNLTEDCLCNWQDLENINDAVKCFAEHFERRDDIAVLVDSDP